LELRIKRRMRTGTGLSGKEITTHALWQEPLRIEQDLRDSEPIPPEEGIITVGKLVRFLRSRGHPTFSIQDL
jgi:hypothetical protein